MNYEPCGRGLLGLFQTQDRYMFIIQALNFFTVGK